VFNEGNVWQQLTSLAVKNSLHHLPKHSSCTKYMLLAVIYICLFPSKSTYLFEIKVEDKYIALESHAAAFVEFTSSTHGHKATPEKCMTIQCACLRQMTTKVGIMYIDHAPV